MDIKAHVVRAGKLTFNFLDKAEALRFAKLFKPFSLDVPVYLGHVQTEWPYYTTNPTVYVGSLYGRKQGNWLGRHYYTRGQS